MCEPAFFEAMVDVVRSGFWIVLAVGVFGMLRRGHRSGRRKDPIARSISVLNERYARGEVDRDEYLERKAYLD